MNIEKILQDSIQAALLAEFEVSEPTIALQPTRKDFEGFYTFVVFPYVKALRKSPVEIGNAIGNYLVNNTTVVSTFNVVQGFLNISIADTAWKDTFNHLRSDASFGQLAAKNETVMVEYSSPNTNKPLHLGHLRNNFLGYSVAQILDANGYDVIKANLVNDRGIHICKSMLAYQKFGQNETPASASLKGDHLVGKYYVEFDKHYKVEVEALKAEGISEDDAKKQAPLMKEAQEMLLKWEQGDEEVVALWQKMNDWVFDGFNQTYLTMGVSFDKIYKESNTYLLGKETVEEGLASGVFFQKEDGSVWIDLADEGLDQKLVLRKDGTSVYITQDMGTADLKYKDFGMSKSLYVVGNEQDYHFEVLFKILKKLGRPYAEGCYHLSYGMVDLPSGKMKSREGTVVDADDLMQEMKDTARERTNELGKIDGFTPEEAEELYSTLAMGALKYFLLKVDPKKRMLFNPAESIDFQGNTGPFIQYTHARICSILKKAEGQNINIEEASAYTSLHEVEREIIFALSEYPRKVADAGREYSPALIAQYVYDLAKSYNRLFAELSIFSAESPEAMQFRVQLSKAVGETIKKAMALLGIKVPTRM
ncbi:arginine--tRNA ligase [Flectobacillus sp. BAB-3569]|uniref:arginine--tRNA ligase n=1 Tax=Flectobacillus sp. BAB-3569 TaxID=1509483 RepID=UPI000BA3CDB0|nr:arginine--tRNA ligase [Flectobacillus sp. BAB-3569]PAC33193.1 arginine--tRNA ligase [Flectobacillus sp. BAB-3569]